MKSKKYSNVQVYKKKIISSKIESIKGGNKLIHLIKTVGKIPEIEF